MRRVLFALVLVACSSEGSKASPDTDGGSTSPPGSDGGAPGGEEAGAPADGGVAANPCERPKPGPTTTGVPAGTKLTPSGTVTVTEDGAVVEDLDVSGEIVVKADNVTIRRVRITSGDYYPIRYDDHRGLLIEDSEIVGTSDAVTSAVSFAHYTARRVDVHGGADGFKADEDVLIEDCWIHDLRNGRGQHNDGVQSTGGKNVTLRHNVIAGASNACVQTGDENARVENLTIECNWLSGGGYTLNIRGKGATVPTGTKIIGNRFGRDHGYGPWTIDDPSPTIRDNVYDDDGTPIPYP
ncbi:MAG: right-handed parallel beta-helix repeat-containing protein [Labilithrix sp.]|nr:right-handed parallel beta-helix repeat-containing protein [Labilithrix sp.]MCW5813915.1 right-handed parallel beta-helix repeat-containing protein [Labilithrix sp.]